MRGGRGARREDPSVDEVDEMLRAAEDDLLLNLTRNSHSTARRLESPSFPTSLLSFSSSPSPLDADLAARFDALKLPTAPSCVKQPNSRAAASAHAPLSKTPKDRVTEADRGGGRVEDEGSSILGNDLSVRFAALKGGSAATNHGRKAELAVDPKPVFGERRKDDSCQGTEGDGGISESEVEKVLQWAMDAARLEPSSSIKAGDDGKSSEEDDDKEKEEEDSGSDSKDDDENDDHENTKRPAGAKAQGKGNRRKKWFIF